MLLLNSFYMNTFSTPVTCIFCSIQYLSRILEGCHFRNILMTYVILLYDNIWNFMIFEEYVDLINILSDDVAIFVVFDLLCPVVLCL